MRVHFLTQFTLDSDTIEIIGKCNNLYCIYKLCIILTAHENRIVQGFISDARCPSLKGHPTDNDFMNRLTVKTKQNYELTGRVEQQILGKGCDRQYSLLHCYGVNQFNKSKPNQ